jgi:putative tryptophan/tyrosine transport system substrate-binding protein
MKRRTLLFSAAAAIAAPVRAQPPDRPYRVGWLTVAPIPMLESFRRGLRDLGYTEGTDLEVVTRYADGDVARVAPLAVELARRTNVMVVAGSETMRIVHRTVKATPVVFVASDPVGQGVVESLARPGANMTGLSLPYHESGVKWLEMVNELLPAAARIAVLTDKAGAQGQFDALRKVASALRKDLVRFEIVDKPEFVPAFLAAQEAAADAMIVTSSPLFAAYKHAIVAAAEQMRIPTIYEHRDFVEAGGLISYGPDLKDIFRRAAHYVDRILKGANPGDLPVEQATKFELTINLMTARSLGIGVPPTLLARADEVIE